MALDFLEWRREKYESYYNLKIDNRLSKINQKIQTLLVSNKKRIGKKQMPGKILFPNQKSRSPLESATRAYCERKKN